MRTCLVHNDKFDDEYLYLLQQHDKTDHKFDVNNYFYQNLFKKQRGVFSPNKCAGCDYFYLNSKDKITTTF